MRPPFSPASFALCLTLLGCAAAPSPDPRPNLLLIVADDLGYADLGVFGSDIDTPNIDAIASEGILMTRFHTAPLCAPTRSMLLTGNNNHVAGMGRQSGSAMIPDDVPGYEAHLSDRVAPLPRLLRAAGYHTYTVGKWHLGRTSDHSPAAAGFERSFSLVDGAGNHFNATGFFEGGSIYREDGREVPWPTDRYSTDLYTDRLIEFIDEGRPDGRPFFAFAAYTSPHWPLQVPDDELDRYAGHYDAGYDRLREDRFESLKRAGIVPQDWTLPPRNDAITPWDSLSPDRRHRESRKMELYAAMVSNLDRHVGRLFDHLRETGLYDNTLIVFMADNGAAAEDFYNRGPYRDYLRAQYDNAYENMGRSSSWVAYGPQWAEAGSAPFSRYKGYTREGGISAPMIVAGPGVARRGAVDRSYLTVMDIAPTFLVLADARYPTDGSVRPMLGESLVPFLAGDAAPHDSNYVTALYHAGRAFVRQGRWKLVNTEGPFDESRFELYDVEADPGETTDLSGVEPDRSRAMILLWRRTRRDLGILLPEDL